MKGWPDHLNKSAISEIIIRVDKGAIPLTSFNCGLPPAQKIWKIIYCPK